MKRRDFLLACAGGALLGRALRAAQLDFPDDVKVTRVVGFYMQLHVGRAIPNFYRAEHDPLTNDVLVADGYAIDDGVADLPDASGAGLALDEARFASEATIRFDVS